jgi:hypothetical protein
VPLLIASLSGPVRVHEVAEHVVDRFLASYAGRPATTGPAASTALETAPAVRAPFVTRPFRR